MPDFTPGYTPKFQKQLNNGSSSGGTDCGVRSTSMGVDFATYGDRRPSVENVRDRMGKTQMDGKTVDAKNGGVTNTEQSQRAYLSFDTPKETAGRQPLKCGRFVKGSFDAMVRAIEEGKWVQPTVRYGVVNDKKPALSGDKNFDDNHIVGILGIRTKSSGERMVTVYDPLCDGRAPGIPKGTTEWPLWLLREATGKTAGPNHASWVQVPPRSKL